MAREDIIMDAEYGEVEMSGRVAGKTFHNFRLLDSVEDADNADFRHGEITVPADFLSSYSDAKGIHIRIPYTPDNRLLTGPAAWNMCVAQPPANAGFLSCRNMVTGRGRR